MKFPNHSLIITITILSRVALPVLIGHAGNVFGGAVSCASGVYTFLFHLESLLK